MSLWLIFAISAVTVILDQISKWLTVEYLRPAGTVPIIRDVLHLTYVENAGAAFGMLKDQRWVFMVISSVAIIALIVFLVKTKPRDKWECLSLAFIIGGGIGNMIDRSFKGYVVDMIDFRLIHFAVFNVADSFVTVGAGILLVWLVCEMVKEIKLSKSKTDNNETADVDNGVSQTADGDIIAKDDSYDGPCNEGQVKKTEAVTNAGDNE